MATSRVAWGIDVGNRALKAIKLARSDQGVRIDDFDVIEHEHVLSNAGDNRETLVQTALSAFVAKHNIRGVPVAVGVSGQQSFARFIKLPPVEPKKIPEIVRFEAIQQIPFPLDEVEWSYQLFRDESSPDVEVGIFAMRKDLVQEHIRFFTDAGLNVQTVQMNPLAVYNGMYYDDRLRDATTMIIDLGAENADLIITEGETIWMRSIPIGGNHFTEALVKAFKLRFEKAEELKRNAATSKYGRQILQAMRPIFADLVSEIQRSIGFYSSVHRDSRIGRVLALGGTFKLPGLQKYLQQNLSLDVHKIDSLGQTPPTDAKVATALNENILSAVSAYGLALQGMGDAKITSSLLPQQIRREKMWREKTKWFAAAAALIVVGTGIGAAVPLYYGSKYDQNEGVRGEIKSKIDEGKTLAGRWESEVQKKGETDRKSIVDVNGLTQYRDLWQNIYKDVRTAVPPAVPPAAGARPAGAAADRRLVLEDLQAQYHPDLTAILAAPNEQIIPLAAPWDWASTADPRVNKGTNAGTGGMTGARPMPMQGTTMLPGASLPGATPPTPDATGATPAPGPGQRGFFVTMRVSTPAQDAISLVNTVVHRALMKEPPAPPPGAPPAPEEAAPAPPAAPPAQAYRVAKILIPQAPRFGTNPDRQSWMAERFRLLEVRANPAQNGANPTGGTGVPGLRPGGAPGLSPAAPRPGSGFPGTGAAFPGMTGTAAGGGAAGGPAQGTFALPDGRVVQPGQIVDPLTGEDLTNWSDVLVLMVIVVDPAAAPAPAAGPVAPAQ